MSLELPRFRGDVEFMLDVGVEQNGFEWQSEMISGESGYGQMYEEVRVIVRHKEKKGREGKWI